MTYDTTTAEQRGAVTLITLNRPQALKALNSQVLEDLIGAFAAFEAVPTCELRNVTNVIESW